MSRRSRECGPVGKLRDTRDRPRMSPAGAHSRDRWLIRATAAASFAVRFYAARFCVMLRRLAAWVTFRSLSRASRVSSRLVSKSRKFCAKQGLHRSENFRIIKALDAPWHNGARGAKISLRPFALEVFRHWVDFAHNRQSRFESCIIVGLPRKKCMHFRPLTDRVRVPCIDASRNDPSMRQA
jgi:hypothetical protein